MEKSEYEVMYNIEDDYWWYQALHQLILAFVKKEQRRAQTSLRILDAGCGTGRLLELLQSYGNSQGIDISQDAVHFCEQRGLTQVTCADLGTVSFPSNQFDIITSVDVLYHLQIADDQAVFNKLIQALKPNGILIINLPAFAILSSTHDQAVHTKKRYTTSDIRAFCQGLNGSIERLSYRCGFLFLPILLVRQLQKILKSKEKPESDLKKLPGFINRLLYWLTYLEHTLFVRNPLVSLIPVGTSVFAVIRKRGK